MTNQFPEIYFSYAWETQPDGSNWSPLVKKIHDTMLKNNFNIKIDVESIQYKDSIKEFMRELGKGNYIVVIISEQYLKSKNCMFEVLEILRYKDTRDRIFPIVSSDAKIHDTLKMVEYMKYWDAKISELTDEAKSLSSVAYAAPIIEDIELMSEIRRMFANFGSMLSEMNVLTPEKHNDSNFQELMEKINSKFEFDQKNLEIKILNEQLLVRVSELEDITNILKLENSTLILENENLKKTVYDQKNALLGINDFQYINKKLEEYEKRILKFENFLGFSKSTTKLNVIDYLGNPTSEDEKTTTYPFYSINYEDLITIYFNKPDDTIMSISVSTGYSLDKLNQYLGYKSLYDSNLKLLNQTDQAIFNFLGRPTNSHAGRLTYEIDEVIVEFTCYEFNENKCSNIEVNY